MAACQLAGAVDQVAAQYRVPAVFTSDKSFGKEGKYSYNSYMHGRQYYYGLSLGAAYKFSDNFSAFAGVRGVYASTNYYGYVENIKVGAMPLYMVLDPTKETAANIELSCDQSGVGFTPIIGVDFKTGKWNFAAKYEFKTRIRLKNKSVNQVPSIGNLPDNLRNAYIAGGVPEQAADAIIGNPVIQGAMRQLKTQFDAKLEKAIGAGSKGTLIHNFTTGFLITLSNPLIIFLFIALFNMFTFVIPGNWFGQCIGYLSIVAGAMLWWLGLTYVINKMRNSFGEKGIQRLNRTIGSIVLGASIIYAAMTLFKISLY